MFRPLMGYSLEKCTPSIDCFIYLKRTQDNEIRYQILVSVFGSNHVALPFVTY